MLISKFKFTCTSTYLLVNCAYPKLLPISNDISKCYELQSSSGNDCFIPSFAACYTTWSTGAADELIRHIYSTACHCLSSHHSAGFLEIINYFIHVLATVPSIYSEIKVFLFFLFLFYIQFQFEDSIWFSCQPQLSFFTFPPPPPIPSTFIADQSVWDDIPRQPTSIAVLLLSIHCKISPNYSV